MSDYWSESAFFFCIFYLRFSKAPSDNFTLLLCCGNSEALTWLALSSTDQSEMKSAKEASAQMLESRPCGNQSLSGGCSLASISTCFADEMAVPVHVDATKLVRL